MKLPKTFKPYAFCLVYPVVLVLILAINLLYAIKDAIEEAIKDSDYWFEQGFN